MISDAVACVVAYARKAGQPIFIERLDFRQKKVLLEGDSRRYSRMLSSFSYSKIRACFLSRGIRQGVEVHQVNPAFSSVIGPLKFRERASYGLSVHQAAGLVLARRLLGCSERIPRLRVCPLGMGSVSPSRTRKEAGEARLDVLGCDLGTAETGACSATQAGKAQRQTQSGSGCPAVRDPRGGLSGDQIGVPG